jgi:hypothetical protein
MAYRIDHNRAMIPPPSRELIWRMAVEGYAVGAEYSTASPLKFPRFSELDQTTQGLWHSIAQAMYAVVAEEGGATKVKLAEH